MDRNRIDKDMNEQIIRAPSAQVQRRELQIANCKFQIADPRQAIAAHVESRGGGS